MQPCVYMVRNEGTLIHKLLAEKGYDILTGNGKMNLDFAGRCDALVPGKALVTETVLEHAPRLKIVSKLGVGIDRIDIPACTAHGVYVANTPTANYISVAEHTITLMLAAAKRIYPISLRLRGTYADWNGAHDCQASELSGKTLSLIGFGNIGSRVAHIAAGFDMQIVAYDPYIDTSKVPGSVKLVSTLADALKAGDFVSIHVAGSDRRIHLINAAELKLMKSDAILINTTRGFVINEEDLIQALKNGTIAGAALDVFTQEPISEDNPLLRMENVIATPHSAANTPEARIRAQKACAENIISCLETGRPLRALNAIASNEIL